MSDEKIFSVCQEMMPLFRAVLNFFFVKIVPPQGCALNFSIKFRDVARTCVFRDVSLNLPEFTLSVGCSIVTYHNCCRRARMALEYAINALGILSNGVSTIRPPMVGA